jgi:hypothetical protein
LDPCTPRTRGTFSTLTSGESETGETHQFPANLDFSRLADIKKRTTFLKQKCPLRQLNQSSGKNGCVSPGIRKASVEKQTKLKYYLPKKKKEERTWRDI